MNIVIFDTETTGLLKPVNSDLAMQPKIIEFYGVRINEEFEILEEVNELISPEEEVSREITRITGITNDMVKDKGSFETVADKISGLFEDCDIAVAHNIAFDNGMLDVDYKRLGLERPKAKIDLCTVEETMGIAGFRLSLTNLHWRLFQQQFNAHRAKDDVFALVRCFHKLTEDKVIDLELYKNRV